MKNIDSIQIFKQEILDFLSKSEELNEASVREEIIIPLLNQLGYSSFGENKIIREKRLEYIQHGVKREKGNMAADYLLQVNGTNVFVLEAKASRESILSIKNVGQARSYATHEKIDVEKFVLCNGYEFAIYSTHSEEPLLHLQIKEIEKQWHAVEREISPIAFTKPYLLNYMPDYGIWCYQHHDSQRVYNFANAYVGTIAMFEIGCYSIMMTVQNPEDGQEYEIACDFELDLLQDFTMQIPAQKQETVFYALTKAPFQYHTKTEMDSFPLAFQAILSGKVQVGRDEKFMPFKITKFISR